MSTQEYNAYTPKILMPDHAKKYYISTMEIKDEKIGVIVLLLVRVEATLAEAQAKLDDACQPLVAGTKETFSDLHALSPVIALDRRLLLSFNEMMLCSAPW